MRNKLSFSCSTYFFIPLHRLSCEGHDWILRNKKILCHYYNRKMGKIHITTIENGQNTHYYNRIMCKIHIITTEKWAKIGAKRLVNTFKNREKNT